ncbi:MAG: hypothetical protein AAGU78_07335 [Chloroflexota bacterium]
MSVEELFSERTWALWGLLGTLLDTLLLVAALLWTGARVSEQGRALWRSVRGQRAALIAAVDEPGDPLIAQLAALTRVPPGVWAVFLPAFLSALAEGLDRALNGQGEPLP